MHKSIFNKSLIKHFTCYIETMTMLIKSISHKNGGLDLILLIPRWSKCSTWLKTCFCHPAVIKYQQSPSFPKCGPKNIKFMARPQWPVCLCSSLFTRTCDFLAGWAISRNYSRSSWKIVRRQQFKERISHSCCRLVPGQNSGPQHNFRYK